MSVSTKNFRYRVLNAYISSLTWATSISSLISHCTSSRSPAIYLPIYASSRMYQSQDLLGCDSEYFDRGSLAFGRNILLPFQGSWLRQQVGMKGSLLPRYTASLSKDRTLTFEHAERWDKKVIYTLFLCEEFLHMKP